MGTGAIKKEGYTQKSGTTLASLLTHLGTLTDIQKNMSVIEISSTHVTKARLRRNLEQVWNIIVTGSSAWFEYQLTSTTFYRFTMTYTGTRTADTETVSAWTVTYPL